MAFENVTLFEIHLDDTTVRTPDRRDVAGGTASATEPEPGDEKTADDETAGRGRVLALVVLAVALAVGVALLAKRTFAEDLDQTDA